MNRERCRHRIYRRPFVRGVDVVHPIAFGLSAAILMGLAPEASAQRRPRRPVSESRVAEPDATFSLEALHVPGGLTAEQAAKRAVEVDPTVHRAKAAVRVARAGAQQAMVGFFPRIEGLARYSRLSNVNNGPVLPPTTPEERMILDGLVAGVDDPEAQTLWQRQLAQLDGLSSVAIPFVNEVRFLQASAVYPVTDLFLTVMPTYRAARAALRAERFQHDAKKASSELQAQEAYFALVRATGALEVAKAALAQAESVHNRTQILARSGAAPGIDVRRTEAQLASAKVSAARARTGVHVASQALRVLLNLPATQPIELGEDLTRPVDPYPGAREDLLKHALTHRQELLGLRAVIHARDASASAQAGARWPKIILSGNFDYANPHPRVFPPDGRWQTSWDVHATLRWSPNDFASGSAALSGANAETLRARADLEALEDGVRVEVVQAYEEQVAARAALEAARTGVEASEANYRGRVAQLEAGIAVTSDLIEADADLARARLDLLNAAVDVRLARARLAHATGGSSAALK